MSSLCLTCCFLEVCLPRNEIDLAGNPNYTETWKSGCLIPDRHHTKCLFTCATIWLRSATAQIFYPARYTWNRYCFCLLPFVQATTEACSTRGGQHKPCVDIVIFFHLVLQAVRRKKQLQTSWHHHVHCLKTYEELKANLFLIAFLLLTHSVVNCLRLQVYACTVQFNLLSSTITLCVVRANDSTPKKRKRRCFLCIM